MQIHVARGRRRSGPFSPEEIRRGLADGTLLPSDLAWAAGCATWRPLGAMADWAHESQDGAVECAPPPLPSETGKPMGLAIVSLIFGILSLSLLPFVSALAAIVCGHIARVRIRRSGGLYRGEDIALAGAVLGYVSLALLPPVVYVAMKAYPAFKEMRYRASQTQAIIDAKQLVVACKVYAVDHQGKFPPKLEDLVPQYLDDDTLLTCTFSDGADPEGYQYFGGRDNDPPGNIVMASRIGDRQGRHVVAYVDGSAEIRKYPIVPGDGGRK